MFSLKIRNINRYISILLTLGIADHTFKHSSMLTNGEQKIFIWVDFSAGTETAILHGVQIASILGKEICLMHLYHQGQQPEHEKRLQGYGDFLSRIPGTKQVHLLVSPLSLTDMLTPMAEEYDALLLIAHKDQSLSLLSKLPKSGFPFLFVSSGAAAETCYEKITVPIGYMKKGKDLALWSSYFARHNHATVTLVKASHKLGEDNRRVESILISIERLFKKFTFPYQIMPSGVATYRIQKEALKQATESQEGLLIISFTHQANFIDRLLKLNDQYIIEHSGCLSVMCINSQRDLYTFCG